MGVKFDRRTEILILYLTLAVGIGFYDIVVWKTVETLKSTNNSKNFTNLSSIASQALTF
jgi:hypothetical protein